MSGGRGERASGRWRGGPAAARASEPSGDRESELWRSATIQRRCVTRSSKRVADQKRTCRCLLCSGRSRRCGRRSGRRRGDKTASSPATRFTGPTPRLQPLNVDPCSSPLSLYPSRRRSFRSGNNRSEVQLDVLARFKLLHPAERDPRWSASALSDALRRSRLSINPCGRPYLGRSSAAQDVGRGRVPNLAPVAGRRQ
jgi:hypothetical protein